jgi:hypothetical protein
VLGNPTLLVVVNEKVCIAIFILVPLLLARQRIFCLLIVFLIVLLNFVEQILKFGHMPCLLVLIDLVWRGPLRSLQYCQTLILPSVPRLAHFYLLNIGLLLLPINEHVSFYSGEAFAARHMRCLRIIVINLGLLTPFLRPARLDDVS